MDNNKQSYKSKILKRILPTYLISATIPAILCIFIPFEIFGKNQSECLFSFSQFIPMGILFAFLFTLVFFFTLLFLPNKAYKIASAIVIAFAFLFFLQGTFLNSGMTALAGDNLGGEAIPLGKSIFNLIIWIVVIAGAVVLALLKDKNGIISLAGVLLCGIVFITQLMSPIALALTTEGVFAEKGERISLTEGSTTPKILTYNGLNEVSTNRNVIIFLVDRFDQEYANDAYEQCPELFNELNGFTAFDDNLSSYSHTFPSVPSFLTRKEFDISKGRAEFLNSAYINNQTLDNLDKEGYKINLFAPSYYAYTDASFLPSYVSNVAEATDFEVEKEPLLSLSMTQMSLYRCFPLMFKRYVGNINSSTCNDYVLCEGSDNYSQYTTNMEIICDEFTKKGLTTTDEKLFSFIHLDGCHDPIYDQNAKKIKRGGSNLDSLKASFKVINTYIREMKKWRVYNDATIIITGDHSAPHHYERAFNTSSLTALFFKPSGSGADSDTLSHNTAPVCHNDVWPSIFESENLSYLQDEPNLFEIDQNDNERVRTYHWHNYFSPTTEKVFKIRGAGDVLTNWKIISEKTYYKFLMD